jgi:ankyrin repeat protein
VLHSAAGRGHDAMVRILLEGGADTGVMDNRRMVLYFAAGYASEKVFKMLLNVVDKGIFGIHDVEGQTALQLTAKGKQAGGKYEAVRKLVRQG